MPGDEHVLRGRNIVARPQIRALIDIEEFSQLVDWAFEQKTTTHQQYIAIFSAAPKGLDCSMKTLYILRLLLQFYL